MMSESHLRIGVYLLAIALVLSALPVRTGFAEDVDATHNNRNVANPSAETGSAQTPSGEDAASASAGKDSDDIDTRITVQPHSVNGKPGKAGNLKAKPNAPIVKNLHRRTFSASRASTRTLRNAISVPITSHQGMERSLSEHIGAPSSLRGHASGTGVPGTETFGSARSEVEPARRSPAQAIGGGIGGPTSLNRGVSGTSLSRPGASASGIGGPAKTVAGINGSAIRPSHFSSP
jgi:hypothetical protein